MATASVQTLKPALRPAVLLRSLGQREGVDLFDGTNCSACHLREICLPCGLCNEDIEHMDELVYGHKRVKRGQCLYHAGDSFHSLYAVRTGAFKSNLILEDGHDVVTGFHMMGDILGMDGIGSGTYACNATALDDCDVCALPYMHLEKLSGHMRSLQPHIHRIMSREIVRENGVMLWLGSMRAEQRLAAFLLDLSQRFFTLGYSPSEFNLRMTREEISSYLGMKQETLSRQFSRFQSDGLISIRQKQVRILDATGLRNVMGWRSFSFP